MSFKFKTNVMRSMLMKKIKSVNTKSEVIMQRSFKKEGLLFKMHSAIIPGVPDFVLSKSRIAVFIDGEFWHGYKWATKKKTIRSNRRYWIPKIERTIKRDKMVNQQLKKIGWLPLRFWHNEVMRDINKCTQMVIKAAKKRT